MLGIGHRSSKGGVRHQGQASAGKGPVSPQEADGAWGGLRGAEAGTWGKGWRSAAVELDRFLNIAPVAGQGDKKRDPHTGRYCCSNAV